MSSKSPASPDASDPRTQIRRAPARLRQPFESLRHEIDRFIHAVDHVFAAPAVENVFTAHWPKQALSMVDPMVDIVEMDGGYELRAELPGLAAADIEVSAAEGLLRLKGHKRERSEVQAKDYVLHERHFGSFERAFRIPEGIDSSRITAIFKDGVLTVSMPREMRVVTGPRRIPVSCG